MPDPAKVFEGKPCKNCGGMLRWRNNRGCVECARRSGRASAARRYASDAEFRRRKAVRDQAWRDQNPEKLKQYAEKQRERYRDDPAFRESVNQQNRESYWNNPDTRARSIERNRERHERLYWGSGIESFIYRAGGQLRTRRNKALKRMEERNQRRANGEV